MPVNERKSFFRREDTIIPKKGSVGSRPAAARENERSIVDSFQYPIREVSTSFFFFSLKLPIR